MSAKFKNGFIILLVIAAALLFFNYYINYSPENPEEFLDKFQDSNMESESPVEQIPEEERDVYDWILIGAREEVSNQTVYNDEYHDIDYPGGDVPEEKGACSDVIIRSLRTAGYDLQKLMHKDMRDNFELYPQKWGLSEPDPNIDHRRVANQMVFFERFGRALDKEDWQHGDIVCWEFPDGRLHTGIISDRTNQEGNPLVIHNGSVAREEDCLERWEIIGHYRFPPQEEASPEEILQQVQTN